MTKEKTNIVDLVPPSADMDWLARAIEVSLRVDQGLRGVAIRLDVNEARDLVAFIDAANGKTKD